MFESWLLDLLATHLGRFVDVKREQLKVSLWSGVVLENVNLCSDALDYLQLPVRVEEGSIGRLQIQVPWRSFGTKPFIIELSDVTLTLCPRQESEWECEAGNKRHKAAKLAALAAAEFQSLNGSQQQGQEQEGATNPTSQKSRQKKQQFNQQKQSMSSTLIEQLCSLFLNQLQLVVTNVHLQFRDCLEDGSIVEGGICIGRLETCYDYDISQHISNYEATRSGPSVTSPLADDNSKKIQRCILLTGCSLYWHDIQSVTDHDPDKVEVIDLQRGNILNSTNLALIVAVGTTQNSQQSNASNAVELELVTDEITLQISNDQLQGISRTVNRAQIWNLRNKYARFRPKCMVHSNAPKNWRHVWQYAILAVQEDVRQRKPPWWKWTEKVWTEKRKRMVDLYSLRLATKLQTNDDKNEFIRPLTLLEEHEISQLEDELCKEDILLFRQLAEQQIQKVRNTKKELSRVQQKPENNKWIAQRMLVGISGFLGYVPNKEDGAEFDSESVLEPPSNAEIIELVDTLQSSTKNAPSELLSKSTFVMFTVKTSLIQLKLITSNIQQSIEQLLLIQFVDCGFRITQQKDYSHWTLIVNKINLRNSNATNSSLVQIEQENLNQTAFLQASGNLSHTDETDKHIKFSLQPMQLILDPALVKNFGEFFNSGSKNYENQNQFIDEMSSISELDTEESRVFAMLQKLRPFIATPGMEIVVPVFEIAVSSPGFETIRIQLRSIKAEFEKSSFSSLECMRCMQQIQQGIKNSTDCKQSLSWAYSNALYSNSSVEVEEVRIVFGEDEYEEHQIEIEELDEEMEVSSMQNVNTHCNKVLQNFNFAAQLNLSKLPAQAGIPQVKGVLKLGDIQTSINHSLLTKLQDAFAHFNTGSQANQQRSVPQTGNVRNLLVAQLQIQGSSVQIGWIHDQQQQQQQQLQLDSVVQQKLSLSCQEFQANLNVHNNHFEIQPVFKKISFSDHSQHGDAQILTLSQSSLFAFPNIAKSVSFDSININVVKNFINSDLDVKIGLKNIQIFGYDLPMMNFWVGRDSKVRACADLRYKKHQNSDEISLNLKNCCIGLGLILRIVALIQSSRSEKQSEQQQQFIEPARDVVESEKVEVSMVVLGYGVQEKPFVAVKLQVVNNEQTSISYQQQQAQEAQQNKNKNINIKVNIDSCQIVAPLLGQRQNKLFLDVDEMVELIEVGDSIPGAILHLEKLNVNYTDNDDLYQDFKLLDCKGISLDILESSSSQVLVPIVSLQDALLHRNLNSSGMQQFALDVSTLEIFLVSSEVEVAWSVFKQLQFYYELLLAYEQPTDQDAHVQMQQNSTETQLYQKSTTNNSLPLASASINLDSFSVYMMGVQQQLASVLKLQKLNSSYEFQDNLNISIGWQQIIGMLVPQPIERLSEGILGRVFNTSLKYQFTRPYHSRLTPAKPQSWYSVNEDQLSSPSTRQQTLEEMDFFSFGDGASGSNVQTNVESNSEIEYVAKADFENDYNSFQSLMTSVGTDDYALIRNSCEQFGAQLVLFSIGGNGNEGKITTPYPCQFSFLAAQIYNQNRKLVQSVLSVPQFESQQSSAQSDKVDVAPIFSSAFNKWIIKSKLDNLVICVNHNGWDIVLGMFSQCSEVFDACQTQHRRLKYEFSSHLSRLPSSNHGDDNSMLSNIQTVRFECSNIDVYYGHLNVSPESSQSLPIMRLRIMEPLIIWNQFVGTSILQIQQVIVSSCACKWRDSSWLVFQSLGEIIGIKQINSQAYFLSESENIPLRINFGVSNISLRFDYESLVVVFSLITRCSLNQNFDNQTELMRNNSPNVVKIPDNISQILKRGVICTLTIDQIACLVSHNSDSILVPIMEIVFKGIETEFSVTEQSTSSLIIQGSASLGLLADVYNDDKLGWEPLLEPWTMDLQFSLLNTLAAADPYSRNQVLNSVSLFSNNSLELSLSAPIMATIGKLQELQKQIQASSKNFSNFIYTRNKNQGTQITSDQEDQYVLVWLHNLCGQSIQYLLSDQPIFSGAQHNKSEFIQVEDQQPVKLLQVSSALARKKGRYMDSLADQNNLEDSQLGSLKHQHFYFYVEGDSRMFGPRDLSTVGIQTYEAQISQRAGGMDAPKTLIQAQVICEVQKEKYGTRSVYIHSRLQLCNKTALTLRIGYPQNSSAQAYTFVDVTGGSTFWLPIQQVESGSLCVKPLPSSSYAEDAYKWSQSIKLKDILPQIESSGAQNSSNRGVKQSMDKTNSSGIKDVNKRLVCLSNNVRIHESVWVNVGVRELSGGNGYAVEIRPTLEVVNQLPVPCEVVVHEVRQGIISYREVKLNLGPGACDQLPNINGLYTNQVSIKPLGFSWSRIVELPPISSIPFSSASLQAELDVDSAQCCRLVPVDPIVQGGPVSLFVERSIEECSEMATLTFSCAYWVYNYTGIPIALKEADTDVGISALEDSVPRDWILPFNQSQAQPYAYDQDQPQRKSSQALESVAASRSESSSTLVGLAEVIEGAGGRWRGQIQGSIRGTPSLASPAGSMMGPSLVSAQWPSMFGKVLPNEQTVKLRVRASQVQGINTNYWSEIADLDALGGAAVVKVLCPIMGNGPQIKSNSKAAYYMSVTASRVNKGQRAWQLHIMPRFVLHNSTEWTIQYKQINTLMDKELLPGCRRPIHWANNDIDCRLSVRIQEAGWMWSGGFSLEKAGDFFVKIRQRDAGDTVLLRVDISSSPTNGVILVRMSHQAVGFAPYRLDNFSSETLHVRQEGCTDQEDVLKPYCQLPYAWDEPSLPHQLILELPGHRYLGTFDLDNVGDQAILRVPSNPNNPSTRHNQREHQLHAVVLAEGPTRVLAVMDMGVHIGHPLLPDGDQNSTELLGWEEWSLPPLERQSASQQSHSNNQVTFFPRATLEIKINVASIGLSLVGEEQELVYIGTRGIQVRFCNSKVRQTLEMVLNQVYWDNCLADATFPVMLAIPVVRPVIGTGVLLDNSRPAVSVRIAVWNRRPGGVICAQLVGVDVAPLALEVEEGLIQHLVHFAATLNDWQQSQTLADQREGGEREEDLSSESIEMDPLSTTQQTLSQHKVYIEKLQISQLDISISFTLVQWSRNEDRKQSILRRVAALADVNDARISLARVDLSHPLMGASALREFFVSHYFNSLLRELYKLVGSADLLGDPVGLVRHLRLGVWSLIANPTSSLLDTKGGSGISGFASGLATGINSMIINTTFALSNATSKMSSAARNSLLALGLEEGEKRASRSRHARAESSSLIQATLQGVAGVVSEPVKGFEQGGVVGLAKGSVAGALGVVARPLASVLDMSNVLANNILSYIDSSPGQLLRARVPRYVSSKLSLEKYDYLNAVGQQLVGGILSGEFRREQFWACFELQDDHCYLILTHQMLLHIQVPEVNYVLRGSDLSICSPLREPAQLLWAINLGDVEFINREDKTVRLMLLSVSSPADLQDSSRKYAINLGNLLPPLQTIRVGLRESSEAERALQIIQLACKYAAKRYQWLGGTVGTTLIVNNSQKNV